MDLGNGIRRIGNGLVNAYLVEEAGEVTIIDAGLPGYWRRLPGELAAMGRALGDVRAVVLTHAHSDHIGFAERIRRERQVPVRVHDEDAALARGEVPNPNSGGMGSVRVGPLLRFGWWALRNGFVRIPPIVEVMTFGDGATLDVPGAPRVIHVPGHTWGSAALVVDGRDVVFIGDAMATLNVLNGARGPQLSPFGADRARALESLARLDGVEARLVLPGHGEPFSDGLAEAIRLVRAGAGVEGGGAATGAGS